MNSRPPLKLSQREMEVQYPKLGAKMSMVALGGATYIKHCGEWWLLDAEQHGHGGDDGPA